MTTLVLKPAAAPRIAGLARLAQAFTTFVEVLAEAKQMARDAEQRFPLAIE